MPTQDEHRYWSKRIALSEEHTSVQSRECAGCRMCAENVVDAFLNSICLNSTSSRNCINSV